MPWLRRAFTGLLPWRPGLIAGQFVRFEVDKMALGEIFL